MMVVDLLIELLLMPLVAFLVGLVMVLWMRRLGARIQRRVGPPFLQPLYDVVKLFGKETQISHGVLHDIGIIMAMGGYIAAETLLPVPGMDGVAAYGGIITLTYLMMIPSLGLALGVGQCANPNGSIGISRALTAMLAYDVPFVIVVFGVAYHAGSANLIEIIDGQQQAGVAGWGLFEMPLLAIAGLITLQGSLGKQPFEVYVAPAEIATGPMVEMGGKYLGGLFVMQAFQFYTATVLYVSLFLGGGTNWIDLLLKSFLVLTIPVSVAYLFPRYRTEDLVRLLWKWPVMIGLLGVAFVV
ncbi:MAG: NADH-quinone oxidoreductase subunit H [Gammaproteobacteria bacterium]|jgi:NADH-quinone oxidoreductase subunit H|nr:NADH-quinone oxidoreductase subunit H [Gammaproteobacteria bacterium]MBT3489452.1 NADH-quinone oxidoreductase subunit H [Gammaproteobacteria bacterium]MBT3718644.1 NADH-quinone oxidoreductase subunit H [Gammaproteobacteria bacterium]MBT3844761.1 NADH-quinone oxidoreductase subunit H [Gammaproteobacteria bacterium]MBT3892828.1 NADH-quinone oxidoreductase subunit H [Gammaproteobacteria bacterium]